MGLYKPLSCCLVWFETGLNHLGHNAGINSIHVIPNMFLTHHSTKVSGAESGIGLAHMAKSTNTQQQYISTQGARKLPGGGDEQLGFQLYWELTLENIVREGIGGDTHLRAESQRSVQSPAEKDHVEGPD